MKRKLKQIIFDMRHQPVISWVTLIATVMTVFLIMVVAITQRVKVVPFAPESCRDRLMVGAFIHRVAIEGENDASSSLSYDAARTLYENLDGVERTCFMENNTSEIDIKGSTGELFGVNGRRVDSEFFNIFDHTLIDGRFFTPEESQSATPSVVIAESAARRAFGSTDCVGQTLAVNHLNYTVVGVVKDTSPLAQTGSGDLFIVTGPADPAMVWNVGESQSMFGPVSAALLVKEGVDFQHIRDQVKARYAILDTEFKTFGYKTVYHGAPFDQETIASGLMTSNQTPDPSSGRNMRYILYAILLVVPAINLSSMLHSRMRRRISELGVRRAFGCTRRRIITDIISENFIVTLIGGLVGLIAGIIFAKTYSGLYEDMQTYGQNLSPAMSAVINWGTILIMLAVCFLLNIISAAVPAWQASRLNPVNAINAK